MVEEIVQISARCSWPHCHLEIRQTSAWGNTFTPVRIYGDIYIYIWVDLSSYKGWVSGDRQGTEIII